MSRSGQNNIIAHAANAQISRALAEIQQLGNRIRSQLTLFRNLAKGDSSAPLDSYSKLFQELGDALFKIHDTAWRARNSMPRNAPGNLAANAQGTYAAIDSELRETVGLLLQAFGELQKEFGDPRRAVTPFGIDRVSMFAQTLDLILALAKWLNRKGLEAKSDS